MKTTHKLYDNTVTIDFDPDASRNRYIVTDTRVGMYHVPVPGVTTVIDKALHKPGLLTFPLNAALQALGCVFSEQERKWLLDNEKPLTQALIDSASKAWLARSNKGKDVGTWVHTQLEFFLRREMENAKDGNKTLASTYADTDADQRDAKMINAFHQWYLSHAQIKPLAIEQIVYSCEHGYAGTFDCLLEIDGKTVLCDIKTTNVSKYGVPANGKWTGIYPENFLQLGAYSLAYREENGEYKIVSSNRLPIKDGRTVPIIDDLMVINVTKDGKVHTLKSSELGLKVEDCEQAFLHARDLLNFLTRVRKGDIDD